MMLTPQEAADMAGVSRPSIMSAIKSGKLVAARANAGNKWQISEEQLQNWMASRTPRKAVEKPSISDSYSEELERRNKELQSEVDALTVRLEASKALAEERLRTLDVLNRTIENMSNHRPGFLRRIFGA